MTGMQRRPLWVVAAALSIGAGVIHFVFGPEHVTELGPLGYGFYVSGALQIGWAIALGALLVAFAPEASKGAFRFVVVSGIAINVAILAAWAASRVVGLPAGDMPWTPEAVGRPDAIAAALEAVLVVGLVGAFRGWAIGRFHSSRWLAATAGLALSAVVFGTVLAITPDATEQADGRGHVEGAMVMSMVESGEPR